MVTHGILFGSILPGLNKAGLVFQGDSHGLGWSVRGLHQGESAPGIIRLPGRRGTENKKTMKGCARTSIAFPPPSYRLIIAVSLREGRVGSVAV